MRIKKILIISISAILLTAIIGTGAYAMISDKTEKEAPKKSWGEKLSEIPDVWIKKNSLMKAFDQTYNKSEDELTSYDFSSFGMQYGYRGRVCSAYSSHMYWLQQFNDQYPIELIKKIDNDHICVVYKFSYVHPTTGEIYFENVLTYVVFERETKFLTKKDNVESAGFYEKWEKTGEVYFLTKKLSSSDFKNVKVGDDISSVAAIESAIAADIRFVEFDDSYAYMRSYRLLSDGIMVIEYKATYTKNDGYTSINQYILSSKTFYPYNSDDFPDEIKAVINASDILK